MALFARYMFTDVRKKPARTVMIMLGAPVHNLVAQATSSQGCVDMWPSIPKGTERSENYVFSVFRAEVTEISTA
jgi:hypothetical protein